MSISSMTTLQPGEILLQQTQTSDRRLNDRHYRELTDQARTRTGLGQRELLLGGH
jgi:hypothetical protein